MERLMSWLPISALVLLIGSTILAAAEFRYDPDFPPLVYYQRHVSCIPQGVRHIRGQRIFTGPYLCPEDVRRANEPPPPASAYSLTN